MQKTLRLPSGPQGLPGLGSALEFAKDPLGFLVGLQDKYPGITYQKVLGQHFFILFDADLIEYFLVKNAANYRKNKFLKNWGLFFGQGLLTSDGEVWKKDRKLIQPLFTREKIAAHTETMRTRSLIHFSSWKAGERKEVGRETSALALDIFVHTILGDDLSPEKTRKLGDAFDRCMAYFHFTANPVGIVLGSLPLPVTLRYKRAIRELDSVVLDIVRDRRPKAASQSGQDLVTTLIQARTESGTALTDDQIRDQLMTFFFAGHETTALTLGYAIHSLSLHPEKQARLREELRTNLSNEAITQANVQNLPYLKSVVQETLRLYPSSWMLGRDSIDADVIGGFDVPAGATVVAPTWALHRDPVFFENPTAFEPERWTPEFQAKLPRSKYLPFGYGPRMCLAAGFAMYELQFALANLYRAHGTRLISDPKIKIVPSVTARPRDEIVVEVC